MDCKCAWIWIEILFKSLRWFGWNCTYVSRVTSFGNYFWEWNLDLGFTKIAAGEVNKWIHRDNDFFMGLFFNLFLVHGDYYWFLVEIDGIANDSFACKYLCFGIFRYYTIIDSSSKYYLPRQTLEEVRKSLRYYRWCFSHDYRFWQWWLSISRSSYNWAHPSTYSINFSIIHPTIRILMNIMKPNSRQFLVQINWILEKYLWNTCKFLK